MPISVTDEDGPSSREGSNVLGALARASGHELRNALNGLVVNLEVVRSMTAGSGVSAEPFMGQAVAQSEESIRLAEAAIALMLLIARSAPSERKGPANGVKNEVMLEAGSEADRVEKALAPLVARGVVSVETSGSAVILRIPDDGLE